MTMVRRPAAHAGSGRSDLHETSTTGSLRGLCAGDGGRRAGQRRPLL